jgi:hypothetical protein
VKRILARVASTHQTPIAPYPELAADTLIVDTPWHLRAADEAARAGLSLIDVTPGTRLPHETIAVVDDRTVFTGETLRALVDASATSPHRAGLEAGTALALRLSPFSPRPVTRDGTLPLGLIAGPPGTLEPEQLDDDTLRVLPVCDEPSARLERVAPFGHAPFQLAIADVTRIGGALAHWLHVLELNLAFLHTLRRRAGTRGEKNKRHKGARVHGTAHVAGSLVGAGAEIEAGATVIDSYIGAGVKVAAHSVIVGSVIGTGCHTLIDTHLRRVVAFPGSTLSNVGTTDALLGREIFITTGVQFFAGEPGRTVVVDGVDTGRPVLSGAIGHKTILGARALFQAGVAVPSGSVVVMRPDEGITKFDERGLARASMMRGSPSVDF